MTDQESGVIRIKLYQLAVIKERAKAGHRPISMELEVILEEALRRL